MCDELYQEFPSIIIGGPAGDYFIDCPMASARWAEYQIQKVVVAEGTSAQIFITGDAVKAPIQLPYDGSKKLSDDSYLQGVCFNVSRTLIAFGPVWDRITNSQHRVNIRIDIADNNSCYIVLKFRTRLITIVPGPALVGHHDSMQEINEARAQVTEERLKKMGIPKRVIEHG